MFTAVPPSYDLLNRVLTLRFDQMWRKKAASACLEDNPAAVLDLCCGTGDLIVQLGRKADASVRLSALDYSNPMLELARLKAQKAALEKADFVQGDAADMPFSNDSFDAVGIAFAFRNLTFHNPDRDLFLSEILRVLKPGGRFVIIETSQPRNLLLRKLFHLYLRWVAAPLGGLISGHRGAYRYLAHSAINYYNPFEIVELLKGSGFSVVKYDLLSGGLAAIFVATK